MLFYSIIIIIERAKIANASSTIAPSEASRSSGPNERRTYGLDLG